MTEVRNEAQVKADEILSLAIQGCLEAYMPEHASQYTLVNFVVLTTMQQLWPEGVVVTEYPMFMSNGDMPWYQVLGLIAMHELKAKKEITVGKDNG